MYYKLSYKFNIYGIRMGPGLYFLKMTVNLPQYCRTAGLFNSKSFVNRSKVNNFTTLNFKNNTYIACSLIFVNKIFLFLLLFSVLFSIRIMYQKTTGSSLFRFFFLHHFVNSIFLIVTFTRLNVKKWQSPGNPNYYITWETKNGLKYNLN